MGRKIELPMPLKVLLVMLVVVVILAAIGVIYLTVKEYRPKEIEDIAVTGLASETLSEGDDVSFLTFNIGYGALDAGHDFFMDGGAGVTTESAQTVEENIEGIAAAIHAARADIVFLQEADISSKRSHNINEVEYLHGRIGGTLAFATNFLASYIPYPFPDTIGKVHSGIATLSPYETQSAVRIALPTAFKWPVRVCQLKRCLLVQRIPLEGTDKTLVVINLHLEAYGSGEGKTIQTEVLTGILKQEYEMGNYVIAGGDFNQTFPGADPSLYPLMLTDAFMPGALEENILPAGWQFVTDETTPTSRLLNEVYDPESPNTQYYVIDGYICSPNVEVLEVKTLDLEFANTDHNPVYLRVRLGSQSGEEQ